MTPPPPASSSGRAPRPRTSADRVTAAGAWVPWHERPAPPDAPGLELPGQSMATDADVRVAPGRRAMAPWDADDWPDVPVVRARATGQSAAVGHGTAGVLGRHPGFGTDAAAVITGAGEDADPWSLADPMGAHAGTCGHGTDDPAGDGFDEPAAEAVGSTSWMSGWKASTPPNGRRGVPGGRGHGDEGLLPFARRHLAVVLVAFVVALCLAASYLFRARTAAVPVSVSPATAGARGSATVGAGRPDSSAPVGAGGSTPRSGATPAAASTAASVTVQVIGAVRHPGVVVLRAGSRVQDAIRAVGGLLPAADPGELNLAIVLSDADQVVIGTTGHPGGEVRSGAGSGTSGSSTGGDAATSSPSGASGTGSLVVDLNTATLAQLDELPGVGPATAQRILDWRTQHGRFSSPQELQEVDGIGPKSYAKLAPHVRV